ncbi:MAG: hypothetical protein A2474_01710 [Elusimicrobia bacterium RIFOXYC2_FULL_34_12]|nr:MAG: hypothetical protein A2474_01710 [Elusimicrobia bacterium RIFOXYC2_FULL_34_12]OGS39623.1 MAG: hypothetical protein A2551_04015 [Elusimicrobia bacterium RIFOXYD2_FULL_34_30]HAM39386.1 hypothetical protein [Elusimicrobiota bacterium]
MAETILVVEDTKYFSDILTDELKDCNYNVITKNNGTDALKVIEEKMPDLIILDVKLPDITGTEILAYIRQYDTNVPVIICTAVTSTKLKTYYDRWANAVIIKPVDLDLLLGVVKKELEKSK